MRSSFCLLFALLAFPFCLHAAAEEPAALAAYRQRLQALSQQIPAVVKAAEAAAARQLAHPEMTIRYPWPHQQAFSDEFIARSGSLANWDAYPAKQENPTPDLFIYAARSWEEDGEEAKTVLAESRKRGYAILLIGSQQGLPAELPHDFFLNNGARGGKKDESGINQIANITLGWMWQCEFAAALSRKGQRPGIMMSMLLPGANDYNAGLTPKIRLYPTKVSAEAGTLATAYLARMEWLVGDLAGDRAQGQIARAAALITEHLGKGGRVVAGCMGHAVPMELDHEVKSPFVSLGMPVEKDIKEKMKADDLVLFIGYIGISNPYYDYGKWFREAGLKVIASFAPDEVDPANNADFAVARIDQSWKLGDAEVAIPFPPGKMAPMSVVNQLLLFRMLDEAVAKAVQP
jgi:hypothetical protein